MPTAVKSPNGTAEQATGVVLHRLPQQVVVVPIVGITPLIPGRFSEKAKAVMREKHTRGVKTAKTLKNPKEEAHGRCYWFEDGRPGVPAVNFKCAIVDAFRFFDGITMTMGQRCIYVVGEGIGQLVPIEGESEIKEDFVRNATGVPDIRYRRYFWPWRTELRVIVRGLALDVSSIVNLVDAAGQCGVCEWRPSSPKSKSGIYGTFRVDPNRQIQVEA